MSKVIPLEDQKWPRDHRNIHDDMDIQLSDIYAVASLLGAVDTDDVDDGQVNATGCLLQRMITNAKEISHEHMTLWREELAELEELHKG